MVKKEGALGAPSDLLKHEFLFLNKNLLCESLSIGNNTHQVQTTGLTR
jgi:hypothetical protein